MFVKKIKKSYTYIQNIITANLQSINQSINQSIDFFWKKCEKVLALGVVLR